MKKFLIVIVVLLLLLGGAWLGTTWFVGQQAEVHIRQFLEQTNKAAAQQGTQQGLQQELVSYQRSLFSSTVVTRLKVNHPILGQWLNDVEMVNRVQHGPALLKDGIEFGLLRIDSEFDPATFNKDTQNFVETAFAGQRPLQKASALIGFDQMANYELSIHPLDGKTAPGKRLKLDGLTWRGQFNPQTQSGPFQISSGAVEWRDQSMTLTAPRLTAQGENKAAQVGSLQMQVPDVMLRMTGSPDTIRFDADLTTSTQEEAGLLQGETNLTISDVSGFKANGLAALTLDLNYAGLRLAGLQEIQRLQQKMESLQSQLSWNMEQTEMPEGQQQMEQLLSELQAASDQLFNVLFRQVLVADKTKLQYTLDMRMQQGDVQSNADLLFKGIEEPVTTASLFLFGPADWGRMLAGDLQVVADKAAVPQAWQRFLAYPVQAEGVVATDSQYRFAVRLMGEEAELNGKRIDLANLARYFMPMTPNVAADATPDIPPAIMERIEQEGLTPELVQELENSSELSEESLELLQQLEDMSQQLQQ